MSVQSKWTIISVSLQVSQNVKTIRQRDIGICVGNLFRYNVDSPIKAHLIRPAKKRSPLSESVIGSYNRICSSIGQFVSKHAYQVMCDGVVLFRLRDLQIEYAREVTLEVYGNQHNGVTDRNMYPIRSVKNWLFVLTNCRDATSESG